MCSVRACAEPSEILVICVVNAVRSRVANIFVCITGRSRARGPRAHGLGARGALPGRQHGRQAAHGLQMPANGRQAGMQIGQASKQPPLCLREKISSFQRAWDPKGPQDPQMTRMNEIGLITGGCGGCCSAMRARVPAVQCALDVGTGQVCMCV